MRSGDGMQESLFTAAKLDDFVPGDHPLRAIQVLVNEALSAMNARLTRCTPTPAATRLPPKS